MITDAAQKAEMAKIADGQKQIEECPVFLLWVADLARSKRVAESAAADLDGSNFFKLFGGGDRCRDRRPECDRRRGIYWPIDGLYRRYAE